MNRYEKKDILVLGKGTTEILDNTTFTAEKEYSIICTEQQKKFCKVCFIIEIYLLITLNYIN